MREHAVTFGKNGGLLGVLTEPDVATAAPHVLLFNAGFVHHVGPARLAVDLARNLADAGFPALRFDFSGIGDSEPRVPHPGAVAGGIADARDAMDYLRDARGARRFVLCGLCSGARHAHHVALADRRVIGAILLDGPAYPTARYWALEAWRRRRHPIATLGKVARRTLGVLRASAHPPPAPADADLDAFFPPDPPRARMAEDLRALCMREVSLLSINSGEWRGYGYEGQLRDAFARVPLDRWLTERRFATAEHLYFTQPERAVLLDTICSWLEERAPAWSSRSETCLEGIEGAAS